MKKYLLLLVVFSLVLLWCQKIDIDTLDIAQILDLATLQDVIAQVSEEIEEWTISGEQAQTLVNQLQQRYVELTSTSDNGIETTFATLQKTLSEKDIVLYWLPLWARRIWMIQPQGMQLDKSLSTQSYDSGHTSTILVYTWNYTIALQQAKIIADRAHLFVTKNFQQAQSLAKVGNVDYISGLDIGDLRQWIVYVNHELLDTNIDQMLSVSVDQNGLLTLEASTYTQPQNITTGVVPSTWTSLPPIVRKQWENCGENDVCDVWLKCSYPCGIQGCKNVCQPEDELAKP